MTAPIRTIFFAVALTAAGSLASGAFADNSMTKSGDSKHSDDMTKDLDSMKKDKMGD